MVSRYFSSRRTLSALLTQTLSALPAAAGGRRLTCLPDVSAGRNATRIALGAGDAGVMDAGEWVLLWMTRACVVFINAITHSDPLFPTHSDPVCPTGRGWRPRL